MGGGSDGGEKKKKKKHHKRSKAHYKEKCDEEYQEDFEEGLEVKER